MCVAEGVFTCGCVCVCACVKISFKRLFAQIRTVYFRWQFQVEVTFIVVKYSVTRTNYNSGCVILRHSCNYSACLYLMLCTLRCLVPDGDFKNI